MFQVATGFPVQVKKLWADFEADTAATSVRYSETVFKRLPRELEL
jgi:hypothetical protein